MTDENGRIAAQSAAGRFLGSLKEALQAAGRADQQPEMELPEATQHAARQAPAAPVQSAVAQGDPSPVTIAASKPPVMPVVQPPKKPAAMPQQVSVEPAPTSPSSGAAGLAPPSVPSAADAAREARGGAPRRGDADHHFELEESVTRVVRPAPRASTKAPSIEDAPRTQVLRGRQSVARGEFKQDPVVGWLVVVGGNGLGNFRPVFEGNNAIGRGPDNRVAIDFGDEAISASEQAYIRYDSNDRSFLLVPNLAKTNVVALNDKRPTSAVPLAAMDVITMGRTQLVFVPFCGPDFDWSELGELRG